MTALTLASAESRGLVGPLSPGSVRSVMKGLTEDFVALGMAPEELITE